MIGKYVQPSSPYIIMSSMAVVARKNLPRDGDTIRLTKPQSKFFVSKAKYPLFCGGFGSGKSETLFLKLISDKIERPKVDLGYFAPSYQLIRDIAYGRIQNLLDRAHISYQLNKSDNNLYLQGYGKIIFRTLEVPERIIGFEIFNAYLDEIDTMRDSTIQEAWNKIMARCRQIDPDDPEATNRILSATTPEGYKFCYRRWKKDPVRGYELIKAPTYSNPYLPPDYIQSLRDSYPANLIEAYLDGEFVNLTNKTVYSNFDRRTHHSDLTAEDSEELRIGMDFNINNMCATVHIIKDGNPVAVDELVDVKDTPAMVEAIKYKYPNHKIIVYPDSSGNSASTMDANVSDLTILRKAGFTLKYRSKNPSRRDRIMAMQSMFLNGNKEIRYRVNTDKCPEFVNALEQQVFDKNGVPEKDPGNNIDDLNDSAGYFIHYEFPVQRREFVTNHTANY